MEVPAHLRIRMAKRNLSHAYLVVGENRRPLAEALAAAWVCTGETPPCGHCPGCRKAGLGIHPDIIRADPEGEGLKAEEVRALRALFKKDPIKRMNGAAVMVGKWKQEYRKMV